MYKNKKTARVGVLVAALILSLMTLCLTDSTAIAYSPDIKVESHWGGPWYAPGEYQYIIILFSICQVKSVNRSSLPISSFNSASE